MIVDKSRFVKKESMEESLKDCYELCGDDKGEQDVNYRLLQ